MDSLPPALAPVTSDALADLCRRYRVRHLDLFGSAADGRFDPARSDLDFLVTFEDVGSWDVYFGLQEGLVELFGRGVDLVMDKAVENPYVRRSIEAQRIPLYPPT